MVGTPGCIDIGTHAMHEKQHMFTHIFVPREALDVAIRWPDVDNSLAVIPAPADLLFLAEQPNIRAIREYFTIRGDLDGRMNSTVKISAYGVIFANSENWSIFTIRARANTALANTARVSPDPSITSKRDGKHGQFEFDDSRYHER